VLVYEPGSVQSEGTIDCNDFTEGNPARSEVVITIKNPKRKDETIPLSIRNYNTDPDQNEGIAYYQNRKQEFTVPIGLICSGGKDEPASPDLDECDYNKWLQDGTCNCNGVECADGKYCINDPRYVDGKPACVEYFGECPGPNEPLSEASSARGFCNCPGEAGDQKMEYCGEKHYCIPDSIPGFKNPAFNVVGADSDCYFEPLKNHEPPGSVTIGP
jgi:hypothetical protein